MKKLNKEFLVGCLVLLALGLMVTFGWLIGVIGPFVTESHFKVLYAFAGGVEVGSPVRVSGVKVGKVEKIEFLPTASQGEEPASLRLLISVSQKASPTVREDSKFYVNMAGIIGERYVEISPGSSDKPQLADGAEVRGVDPPRIDQLLSQGYGVFGRLQQLLEKNEETVTTFLKQVNSVLTGMNEMLASSDKKKIFALVDNLNAITHDLRGVSKGLDDKETKEAFRMLFDLIHRAHDIDKPALKKFLQEEGIRAHIF